MFDLQANAKGRFVIFAVEPSRLKKIAALIAPSPHRWLIGVWKGNPEIACIVPRDVFYRFAGTIMQDQISYLMLYEAQPDGTREATLFYPNTGRDERLGVWRQVDGPVGDSWTFDPSTGFFYHAS